MKVLMDLATFAHSRGFCEDGEELPPTLSDDYHKALLRSARGSLEDCAPISFADFHQLAGVVAVEVNGGSVNSFPPWKRG